MQKIIIIAMAVVFLLAGIVAIIVKTGAGQGIGFAHAATVLIALIGLFFFGALIRAKFIQWAKNRLKK